MLYFLSNYGDVFAVFNLFRYITFRTGGATITALIFVFLFGPMLIKSMKAHQRLQPIRQDGPSGHLVSKQGTPTMGGLMILAGLIFSVLLWADLSNYYVWLVLLMTMCFGMIGFYDDYLKVIKIDNKGLKATTRLIIEFILAGVMCALVKIIGFDPLSSSLALPFLKNLLFDLGWFYVVFGALVIVGSANAVNLTDGLDGLAIVPVMIAAASFGLISYLAGNLLFAEYLQIHFIAGTGELAIVCGAIIGAGLGFLWFNAPPAMIFMGDTGSLALGGSLGSIAVITKHEIVLGIVGGLFVLEVLSVAIQVISFKLIGKRVFKMAPIHHHFEHLGWSESQIVMRFWIIAIVLALIGLSSLKLR